MQGRVEAGVLHPGAMGASLGAALRQNCATVTRSSPGRSTVSQRSSARTGSSTRRWWVLPRGSPARSSGSPDREPRKPASCSRTGPSTCASSVTALARRRWRRSASRCKARPCPRSGWRWPRPRTPTESSPRSARFWPKTASTWTRSWHQSSAAPARKRGAGQARWTRRPPPHRARPPRRLVPRRRRHVPPPRQQNRLK